MRPVDADGTLYVFIHSISTEMPLRPLDISFLLTHAFVSTVKDVNTWGYQNGQYKMQIADWV